MARIAGTIIALANIGFITRYLGKDIFGEYVTILSFISIFSIIADLGLYSLLVRDISRPGADEKKIIGNIFSLRLISLIIVLGAAAGISLFFPYRNIVKSGVIIGAFSFFFLSSSQVLIGIFQKYLKMDRVALAEIAGRIVNLALVVWFIQMQLGFLWIVAALTLGSFVNFIVIFLYARSFVPIVLQFDFVFWKKIFKEALPIAISIALTAVYFRLAIILLSVMKPADHVGIYGLAYKVLENLIFFPAMFVGVMMPLLSDYAVSNKEKFKFIFQKSFDILALAVMPVVFGIIVSAKSIILLIGGPDFLTDTPLVLQILAFAIVFIFFGNLFGNSIIALGRQKTAAWIYGAGAIFNIAANIIIIPKYSYFGAAISAIFTEMLVTILMFVLISVNIKFFPSMKTALKALVGALVMYATLSFIGDLSLLWDASIGAFIYFVVIYLLRALNKNDLALFFKARERSRP